MAELSLYLGGTRSGKSARAEKVFSGWTGPVLYAATARNQVGDEEMAERIRRHRARRPSAWETVECPRNPGKVLAGSLGALDPAAGLPGVLFDCVTMWVSNILTDIGDNDGTGAVEAVVRREMCDLLALVRERPCRWVFVSGETGLGGIHATRLERIFCDCLGLANQLLASEATDVFLVVAGRLLPLRP